MGYILIDSSMLEMYKGEMEMEMEIEIQLKKEMESVKEK